MTATTGFIVFFASAMVAHRTLFEARPAARHLTEFYLWMSVGGALGGLAAALIAPKIFPEIFEYPLLLALSMACRPGAITLEEAKRRSTGGWCWVMLAGTILADLTGSPWALSRQNEHAMLDSVGGRDRSQRLGAAGRSSSARRSMGSRRLAAAGLCWLRGATHRASSWRRC